MKVNKWVDKPFIGVKKEKWDALYHGIYMEGERQSYVRLTKEEAMIVLKELDLTN